MTLKFCSHVDSGGLQFIFFSVPCTRSICCSVGNAFIASGARTFETGFDRFYIFLVPIMPFKSGLFPRSCTFELEQSVCTLIRSW